MTTTHARSRRSPVPPTRDVDDCGVVGIRRAGTTITLMVRGDLDVDTRARFFTEAVDGLTRRPDVGTPDDAASTTLLEVVVDAAGLGFVDAAGLGVLVTLRSRLAGDGIALRTVNAPPRLRRLSAICRLDDALGITTPVGDGPEPGGSV